MPGDFERNRDELGRFAESDSGGSIGAKTAGAGAKKADVVGMTGKRYKQTDIDRAVVAVRKADKDLRSDSMSTYLKARDTHSKNFKMLTDAGFAPERIRAAIRGTGSLSLSESSRPSSADLSAAHKSDIFG